MKVEAKGKAALQISSPGGLAGLVLKPLLMKLRGIRSSQPRLELLERITLAPRQTLALVEAEGRRFLVATSQEGGAAFFALDNGQRPPPRRSPRVSW
jgi:hypothetical protein